MRYASKTYQVELFRHGEWVSLGMPHTEEAKAHESAEIWALEGKDIRVVEVESLETRKVNYVPERKEAG
jgi:hypothetical protein